jgi:hypothetical protein
MGTDVPLCLCSPAKRQLLFQGGVIAFPINKTDEFRTAIADFSANSQDPKAAIIPTYASGQGSALLSFTMLRLRRLVPLTASQIFHLFLVI